MLMAFSHYDTRCCKKMMRGIPQICFSLGEKKQFTPGPELSCLWLFLILIRDHIETDSGYQKGMRQTNSRRFFISTKALSLPEEGERIESITQCDEEVQLSHSPIKLPHELGTWVGRVGKTEFYATEHF